MQIDFFKCTDTDIRMKNSELQNSKHQFQARD